MITVATSGRAALALLQEDTDFHIILCDLMMPDLTGIDVFNRVRKHHPELEECFIFMTGGIFTSQVREFVATVSNVVLEKPFDLLRLKTLIRDRMKSFTSPGGMTEA